MTGEELDTYATLSTCSGASAEIAALVEIKANFSAQSGRRNTPGDPQGAAPEVTIMGANTKEAAIRGIDQLVRGQGVSCDRMGVTKVSKGYPEFPRTRKILSEVH